MKHIHTFESFSNESVTEAEVLLFDEIGPELVAFRSKVEKLIDKSSDDKWITTLKKTMSSLDRLENDLSKADSKLGVVPVDENLNDPVLVAMRAAKEDRKKRVEAQKERMKKRVYGKQREKLEDELWSISQDLKDAYAERRNIYDDMEAEAGEKGDAWSDDDANRYGSRLNLVDDEIENLIKRRQTIEVKLAY